MTEDGATDVRRLQTSVAQDFDDLSFMLELFRTEVEGHAAALSEGLLALERDPGGAVDIEALMRAAHSIKGAARIVGVDAAVALAHAMEDCFVAVQGGAAGLRADHVDVLLRGVDMLTQIAGATEGDVAGWISEHAGQIEGLTGEVSAILTPEPAAAAAPADAVGAPAGGPSDSAGDATPEAAAAAPVEQPPPAPVVEEPPDTAPAPVPPAAPASERVVRISADNLDRLMGLAGEALVETRWLRPFADSLLRLKAGQGELAGALERLRESLNARGADAPPKGPLQRISGGAGYPLLEALRKVDECRRIFADRMGEFETFARRSASLSDRLYREVIAGRMRPFADGVQGFPRMVRDLARKLGKRVRFEILGRSTAVDRDILDKLEAPLTHILRNAVDHGIEMPQGRLAAGKPEEGTVRLEAVHSSGMLSIIVSDDGGGIDPGRLREKILSSNLSSREVVERLTEPELMDFLFLPGFSTAGQVTEISGRGVGLDVVQRMVQEVGGRLRATSEFGAGTTFHLQLPITLSVIRALLVEISGEPYAFPLARIDRLVMVSRDDIESIEDRQYFTFDDRHIGLMPAQQVLELDGGEAFGEALPVVVLSDHLDRYGLLVDRFLGERDLVVRPLDARLGKIPDIGAAAFMEDGAPVLIADVEDMVRSIHGLLSGGRPRKVGRSGGGPPERKGKRVLVVDDSITVREVERKLLENGGYEVAVAVDGMDGWNAVRTGGYDLVVTDVDMPRRNGIELVALIKNDPRWRSLPVVIVSYKDREEDRIRGLEAGADTYLTKGSFQDETLLNAVRDLIGGASE